MNRLSSYKNYSAIWPPGWVTVKQVEKVWKPTLFPVAPTDTSTVPSSIATNGSTAHSVNTNGAYGKSHQLANDLNSNKGS